MYSPLSTPIKLTKLSYLQNDDVCNTHTYAKLYREWNDEYNVTSIKNKQNNLKIVLVRVHIELFYIVVRFTIS